MDPLLPIFAVCILLFAFLCLSESDRGTGPTEEHSDPIPSRRK